MHSGALRLSLAPSVGSTAPSTNPNATSTFLPPSAQSRIRTSIRIHPPVLDEQGPPDGAYSTYRCDASRNSEIRLARESATLQSAQPPSQEATSRRSNT